MKKLYFLALSIFVSVSLMATQVKVAAGTDLQAAVNDASSGDTVLVQAGTYEGNFTMKDGVYVSGGWNEDFTAQTKHASILDAKANGRVLNQPAAFTALTIWDNFTIQNGYLNKYVDQWGPGVALLKNGRVINCLVQNNSFGGEYSGNCAGGGICNNSGGDTCAINCVVRNNKATHGGGIRTAGIAVNCIVENNEATGNGGGVYLHYLGGLHNSIVRNNVCKKDVGGVDMGAAGCAMYNCLIVGNHADGVIGGVQAREGNNVVNTTIVGNSHNTTNADRIEWAGFRASNNTPTKYNGKLFVNNVIWGNKHNGEVIAEQVMPYLKHYVSNGTFANNALQGTTDINATYIALSTENDPQFNDDYSFRWTSPLYNAGSNEALTYLVGDKDVYGNVRKQGENIDLGAVEHTEYTATVELGEGGTLEVDYTGEKTPLAAGEISVPAGFTTKLYVTPAENYVLETITLNGEALVAEEGVYTIPAVTGDITLKVVFDCTLTLYKVAAGEDLQATINKVSSGDTVLVQAGTYEGNFTMKDGVYVSGGWNEDFTAQTEHASILDAKANGRVLNQPANFETLTIWDNFTIQNGKLTAIQSDKLGSGVALMKKGRVINCLIQNNTFDYSGNCMGGGLGQETGDKNDTCAINCVVRNNKGTHGGGVRIRGVILNSLAEKNIATNNGGGIYLQAGAAYNCVIVNNTSNSGGGGVDMFGTGSLVNCLVANNTAGNVGGLSMRSNSRDTDDSGSDIINCTIVNNTQKNTNNPQFCGVRLDVRRNPNRAFVNNVVYGNTINGEVQAQELGGYPQGYGKFLNNAVAGTTANVTYIQLDAENAPQFNENYGFAWTSPLYNAGSNDALAYFVGDKDVYGNVRKQGENIDLGAVEHTVHTLTVAAVENGTLALKVLEQTMPLEAKAYEVPAGFTATILATPAEKYALESILLNGSVLAAVEDVYTLPAVQSDVTLGATFVTESDPDTPTNVENVLSMSQVVAVYDMLGRQISTTPDQLTTGLYIVLTTKGTHKISIK